MNLAKEASRREFTFYAGRSKSRYKTLHSTDGVVYELYAFAKPRLRALIVHFVEISVV